MCPLAEQDKYGLEGKSFQPEFKLPLVADLAFIPADMQLYTVTENTDLSKWSK